MKKYITIAALLAAGTAFANAGSVDTSSWNSVDFTLLGNNAAGYETNGNAFTAGRGGFASLSINGVSLTEIEAADYSWSLSFNLSNSPTTSDKLLFSTLGGGNGTGYCIGLEGVTDGVYTYGLSLGAGAWADKTPIMTLTGGASDMISLTWDALNEELYFSVGVNEAKVDEPDEASACVVVTTTPGETNPDGSIFWTNGGSEKIANISLKASAVPEPSAFGMLAGLGALALVAARRRRK